MAEFRVPELGENIAAGDVVRVLVAPGDTVAKDQPVLELETDKATIEVPSSVAGRVTAVNVKAGDKVRVGQVVLAVEDIAASGTVPPDPQAARPETAPLAAGPVVPPVVSAAIPQSELPVAAAPAPLPPSPVVPLETAVPSLPVASTAVAAGATRVPAAASPSVRRLARELGVDVDQVTGTQAGGRISIDDVKQHAKRLVERTHPVAGAVAAEPLPDFTRWGPVDRQPMRAIRRRTAERLGAAWATIPHVTQHDLADITELEDLRKRYAKRAHAAGASLTVTAIALKVCAEALKVFPQFNVSLDLAAGTIVSKKYVHIGVAVDTDRGLLVPVIRDVDRKNIVAIAVELARLSEKARAGKLGLDEMQGGCFSVSNLGGIGGTYFTPIVNAPEVAILGISRTRTEPVHVDGQWVPRLMLPLSLSYDHRAVDGADGARFLKWIGEALGQPFLLALEG